MKHPLVALEERGAQALTSGDAAEFYRTCLAEETLMVVPGFVVDRATFLQALRERRHGRASRSRNLAWLSLLRTARLCSIGAGAVARASRSTLH